MQDLIDLVDGVMTNARFEAEQKRLVNGHWYRACRGNQGPFVSRGGHRLLYCWQPSTGRHAYINLDTDIALSDDEARATLQTY